MPEVIWLKESKIKLFLTREKCFTSWHQRYRLYSVRKWVRKTKASILTPPMYAKNWKTYNPEFAIFFKNHILTNSPSLFPLNVYKGVLLQTYRTAGCVCCFLMNTGSDTKRQQMFEIKPTNCLGGMNVFSGIEIFFPARFQESLKRVHQ